MGIYPVPAKSRSGHFQGPALLQDSTADTCCVHTVLVGKTSNLKLHDNTLIYLVVLHCRSRHTENLPVREQVKTSESCLWLSNFKK